LVGLIDIGAKDTSDAPPKGAVVRYTAIAIAVHWIVAVLIFANIALSFSADSVPDEYVRRVVDLHKSIGITVLGLAVLRVLWRVAISRRRCRRTIRPWSAYLRRLCSGSSIC
jgi:cytochrome b561